MYTSGTRVLIVDDDPASRRLLEVRLRPLEREARYHLARAYTELGRVGEARAQAEAIRPVDARLADQILATVSSHADVGRKARP